MLRALFILLLVSLSGLQARAEEIVIRGALLVDGSGSPPRENVDLWIRDGRIAGIEPTGSLEARGRVIDAGGMTALPGLIDSHVHFVAAPGTAYRGDSDEAIRELNRLHLRAYLACGITTVLDAGAYPEVARDIQSWLAAGNPGPRYLTTGPYVRPVGGYGSDRFGAEATAAEVEAKLDVIQSLSGAGVKIALEDGFGPFSGPQQFTPDLLDAVVSGAKRRGLPLYVHARTESTQRAALALGAHAIVHAAFDMASPEDLSDGFVAQLRASGAHQLTTLSVVDTFSALYDVARLDDPIVRLVVPKTELETARDPQARRRFDVAMVALAAPWTWDFTRPWIARVALSRDRLLRTLRTGQRNLLRAHRAGVPIVAATDVPSPWPDAIYHFHGPQLARELELLVDAGLTPLEVITAATHTPARMLGLDSELGTLEVGKRADLVLVAGDASKDVRAVRDVRWTIRDGVARTPSGWIEQ